MGRGRLCFGIHCQKLGLGASVLSSIVVPVCDRVRLGRRMHGVMIGIDGILTMAMILKSIRFDLPKGSAQWISIIKTTHKYVSVGIYIPVFPSLSANASTSSSFF